MPEILSNVSPAMTASLFAASVATISILFALIWEKQVRDWSGYLASAAAGLLLTTAIFLFVEALGLYKHAAYLVLGGYLLLFLLNNVFQTLSAHGRVLAPLIAIGAHSFIDGIDYQVLFDLSFNTALAGSAGLILHEATEAAILFFLCRAAGYSLSWAFFASFVAAAVTTPSGTLLAAFYLNDINPSAYGMLLSFAVGAMLYVSTTHLIGHAHQVKSRVFSTACYTVGVLFAYWLVHNHSHGDLESEKNHSIHEEQPIQSPDGHIH